MSTTQRTHCIGDSHAAVFSGVDEMVPTWPERSNDTIDAFRSYRIGAATAYQLETKIPIINDILNRCVDKKEDSVLFCFGEVDIRAHLIKQAELQNISIEDAVNLCVDRYFQVILYYKEQGYNMLAWGPIASHHDARPYLGGPTFGNCLERNHVTELFNNRLELRCSQYSVGFVTIFPKMIDDNKITLLGYLDEWPDSHIHLTQAAMPLILEAFKEKGLI
jgi:hypothetical protein